MKMFQIIILTVALLFTAFASAAERSASPPVPMSEQERQAELKRLRQDFLENQLYQAFLAGYMEGVHDAALDAGNGRHPDASAHKFARDKTDEISATLLGE